VTASRNLDVTASSKARRRHIYNSSGIIFESVFYDVTNLGLYCGGGKTIGDIKWKYLEEALST
jgi:hypothetical protein